MTKDLRREYGQERESIDPSTVDPDPFVLFAEWYDRAVAEVPDEPNAVALATVSSNGSPSVRMVLLKGHDKRGFCFFTNYESRKGVELLKNPSAALCFYWSSLEKQIRIEGKVEQTTSSESDSYFALRPRGAQLGAHASKQSRETSVAELSEQFNKVSKEYDGKPVPRPEHWGGFRLLPEAFEFWQGKENRLHDRVVYERTENTWKIRRLFP